MLHKQFRSGYLCHTTDLIDPLLKYPEVRGWNQLPRCEVCNLALNREELTSEEFEDLRNAYFTQDGVNVYLKNNPVESKLLENLISIKGPFDVVVDHLNACFDGSRLKTEVSVSILKQLKSRGLNCLVVTRKKHYKAFPAHLKTELEKCAAIFISKSESLDDLFVLDATFHSGINTMLLSNDKFHDHACQLGSKMQQAFWRWQRCRQILRLHSSRGDIHLYFPESPDVFVQKSEDGWHIPYGTNSFHFSDKNVLCVRRSSNLKMKV
ncbi:mitochondrial ribonuclease P catalytic subunit-like isoform X2 [Pecten maximus]|uniref:mitochondrial ribonuclease P catalytic subunit-like isoform X2 n=1 Tax=Pecten maximus TaxID=6579 RepID=UPI0014590953|nr:mitochondrial ribonuclease P catalytic subunit-like isoform X2 [Pecten maximus]